MQNTTQMLKTVSEIEAVPELLSMDTASRKRWDSAVQVLRDEILLHQAEAFKSQVFELAQAMLGGSITTEEIHMLISDKSRASQKKLSVWLNAQGEEDPQGVAAMKQVKAERWSANAKPVCQYDLQGKFIAEYPSVLAAWQATGVYEAGITHTCNGRQYSCKGYLWKYKSDTHPVVSRVITLSKSPISVGQYDEQGNLVKTHRSITAAAKTLGVSYGTMRAKIDRDCGLFAGFIWKTIDNK